jgi:hypothetical protein
MPEFLQGMAATVPGRLFQTPLCITFKKGTGTGFTRAGQWSIRLRTVRTGIQWQQLIS